LAALYLDWEGTYTNACGTSGLKAIKRRKLAYTVIAANYG
jgi:hypothetical protein